MGNVYSKKIQQAIKDILFSGDDYDLIKQGIDFFYETFRDISGVSCDNISTEPNIMLPSGKAISSSAAAHCLLELKRTAVFLRGIHAAIQEKLQTGACRPIRILYAGTGPYGTLLLPLLPLYLPNQLQIDLLDVNQTSLTALQKIIDRLAFQSFIGKIYCADAATMRVEQEYDIAISETMLSCLKSEPQVAIMQNIIPQLPDDAVFIPQQISIDAWLTDPKMELDRIFAEEVWKEDANRMFLDSVFCVDKANLETSKFKKKIQIPQSHASYVELKLFTRVSVYGGEQLYGNDSSITLPIRYLDLRKQKANSVEFWYKQGEKPRIESKVSVL